MSATRVWGGCALALLLVGGCAQMSMRPLNHELESPGRAWQSKLGRPITGFVTTDGVYHRYRGWVKLEGDSLMFHGHAFQNDYGTPTHRLAAAEVTTLFGEKADVGKGAGVSVALLLGLGVLGLAILTVVSLGTGL